MTRVVRARRLTFAALAVPNFRRYFAGQAVSLIGTWMQMTAQSWLVLPLTHSSTDARTHRRPADAARAAARAYGGVIADRIDKRRADDRAPERDGSAGAGARASSRSLGRSPSGRSACSRRCWGSTTPSRTPHASPSCSRWSAATTCATRSRLNSVLVNVARVVGPAVAGILIATVGEGICFLVNAGSFAAVVFSLITLNRAALRPPRRPRESGPVTRGVAIRARHARRSPFPC